MNKILLVVDVQNLLINYQPYNSQKVIENIKSLIHYCRETGTEVVYVRHFNEDGDLAKGKEGWQIHSEIAPSHNEKIIDKQYNSAFRNTELKEYLDSKDVKNIILVGLQTEYCIDATCKSAFEQGYNVIIPEECNTTFDNEYLSGQKLYEFYNYKIWNNRFAKVMAMIEIMN